MKSLAYATALLALFAIARAGAKSDGHEECRCVPTQSCWPSGSVWKALNDTIDGQLIFNEPVALPCYSGPAQDISQCAYIDSNYSNNSFQQQFPIGYSYPIEQTCPPVNASAGEIPQGSCPIGDAPVYTVNATTVEHVKSGLAFAKRHNLRLVIRDTGHDLLGRSTGYGSLQIWIKYLRSGITYHPSYHQEGSTWNGAALTIGGGYVWGEVYEVAADESIIVVGGGNPTVGCVGGWMQGGGHGYAAHDFGLGADNVLSARVVLADDEVVTASPIEHQDLFFAIRGGGPGTYGVVVETTVKAYPTRPVVAQTLAFAPLMTGNGSDFLDAIADVYEAYPALSEAGWSGYGQWATSSPAALFAGSTISYAHTMANFRLSADLASAKANAALQKLITRNVTSLFVYIFYETIPTYAAFFDKYKGPAPPADSLGSTTGHFLDETSLLANRTALLDTLRITAGAADQYTTNVVEIFGAPYGQIGKDGEDFDSGVVPGWRKMIMHHILARGWLQDTPPTVVEDIQNDVEFVKAAALKRLAPDAGGYMNEGNRLNPDWKRDWYGSNYAKLERLKKRYDRDDLFYCPTCVGSDRWEVAEDGQLCRIGVNEGPN